MKTNYVIYIGLAIVIAAFGFLLWYSSDNIESERTDEPAAVETETQTEAQSAGQTASKNDTLKPAAPSKTPASANPPIVKSTETPIQPISTIPTTDNLNGAIFRLASYNGKPVESEAKHTVSFDGQSIGAKFCNHIGGNYVLDDGVIKADNLVSTQMYCTSPENIMDIETSFISMLNSGAQISYTESMLILSGSETIMMFTGFIN